MTSSKASLIVLWIVDLRPVSKLVRGFIWSCGSSAQILAMHLPVIMLLMLIEPTGVTVAVVVVPADFKLISIYREWF